MRLGCPPVAAENLPSRERRGCPLFPFPIPPPHTNSRFYAYPTTTSNLPPRFSLHILFPFTSSLPPHTSSYYPHYLLIRVL